MSGLIGLDWGTSSLRAFLFDQSGQLKESRTRPWGIRCLPEGGIGAALESITHAWPLVPILASGMIGSRLGYCEVKYIETPAGVTDLVSAIYVAGNIDKRQLFIIPGVQMPHVADVMRGEETEIIGALACFPELCEQAELVLPGTHSKWVRIDNRRIAEFHTTMTGEVYSALIKHTILGFGVNHISLNILNEAAFEQGVEKSARDASGDLLHNMFSARALLLGGRLAAESLPDYLSGLLLGAEWHGSLACGRASITRPVCLVGEEALCRRYQRAGILFGMPKARLLGSTASIGLLEIARTAGLWTGVDALQIPLETHQ